MAKKSREGPSLGTEALYGKSHDAGFLKTVLMGHSTL
jgi:hypothetical protein